jgi:hypothetical protein
MERVDEEDQKMRLDGMGRIRDWDEKDPRTGDVRMIGGR